MKRFLQCLKTRAIRRRKARDMIGWFYRWDTACRHCWRILLHGPATETRFHLWQRNHHRLCRLIEAKARSL